MFCLGKSYLILPLISLMGCSTQSTVQFKSAPEEAVVSIIDSNGTASTIGKTPLTINEGDVYRGNNRYSQIQIKKDNYKSQEIVLVKSTMGSETVVNVLLTKEDVNQNGIEQSANQEKIANTIARANGMIQSKQYSEAEAVMSNFVELYPNISVGYDYLGNLNYLQKKYSKALRYYKRALAINPQNTDRRNIVEKLELIVKNDNAGDAQ